MGPLQGVKVVELSGLGPAPFCAMMLADMGADVVRVDRIGAIPGEAPDEPPIEPLNRSRRSVAVDLKNPLGVEALLRLISEADVFVEGFRPGVAEQLGVGPDVCLERNPRVVYGRMTGWGQTGPWAAMAGHDINYIALSGTLGLLRRRGGAPQPPANLLGDFGGGGMLLTVGICAALVEAQRSGQGQVIDAAMTDGSALLTTMLLGFKALGEAMPDPMRSSRAWLEPGTNFIDTGAPYYDVMECADGEFVTIGSVEPQFYAELIELLGLAGEDLPRQNDRAAWPAMKERMAALFRTRTRAEWTELFEGTDVCFAPVLSIDEAVEHPHNVARETYVRHAGIVQPAPAPRFSRTPSAISRPPAHAGEHTDEVFSSWGFTDDEIASLREDGAIG